MISLTLAASEVVDSLLESGDYVGAINRIFVEAMGAPIFYGLVFLGLAAALYIRYQSILPVFILGLILFGVFRLVIPTNVIGLVLALMSIAAGVLLYSLFMRRG